MSATFQIERYQDAIAEMMNLYPEHWEEIALDKAAIKLDPDYDRYNLYAEHNYLHLTTVRYDGELVGYFLFIVQPHLHYRSVLHAFSDIVFIRKAFRTKVNGMQFMRFTFLSLKERGVVKAYVNTKIHQYFGPVLKRLGFKEIEHVFSKLL